MARPENTTSSSGSRAAGSSSIGGGSVGRATLALAAWAGWAARQARREPAVERGPVVNRRERAVREEWPEWGDRRRRPVRSLRVEAAVPVVQPPREEPLPRAEPP